MPFTFSHPAAVLLLRRLCPRWLDFPALIIGSLMPDLGYFTGDYILSAMAHDAGGALIPCVPTGWLCYLVFGAAWQSWVALLPAPHRQGLRLGWVGTPWTGWRFARITLSLYLGAWTHLLWDSATHLHGWLVVAHPLLRAPWLGVPVYSWLQHGSSLLGAAALAWAYRRWLRQQGIPWVARWEWRWLLWTVVALGSALWGVGFIEAGMRWGLDGALFNWVTQTILLFLTLSLVLAAVAGRRFLREDDTSGTDSHNNP